MGTWPDLVVGRRWLLTQTGRGALGIAILGVAACGGDADEDPADDVGASESPTETEPSPTESPTGAAEQLAWSRVDLGFVAAFVLVRGQEAAVVDTGVPGSTEAIGTVLDTAGPGWVGVRHVVLTHKHPDHVGSLSEVLAQATGATGYVGEADLPAVEGAGLSTLVDGDEVFGLQIVGTPGHTAGHLAVFDSDTSVLVAGDALTNGDRLTGSNPDFTEDEAAAADSVRKMAALQPGTILVGHGPPLTDGAAAALDDLAASLS